MDIWWKKFRYNKTNKIIACLLIGLAGMSIVQLLYGFIIFNSYELQERSYLETSQFAFRKQEKLEQLYTILATSREDNTVEKVNFIEENKNFLFIAEDKEKGTVLTNMPTHANESLETNKRILQSSPIYLETDGNRITYRDTNTGKSFTYYIGREKGAISKFEIYSAVQEPLVATGGDIFYKEATAFSELTAYKSYLYEIGAIKLFLGLLALIYLTYAAGRNNKVEGVKLSFIDKIPFEIQGTVLVVGAILCLLAAERIVYDCINITRNDLVELAELVKDIGSSNDYIWFVILVGLGAFGTYLGLAVYLSFVRHLKNRSITNNILIMNICKKLYRGLKGIIHQLFMDKTLMLGVLLGTSIYIGATAFSVTLLFSIYGLGLFLFCILQGALFVLVVLGTVQYKKLLNGARKLAAGDLDYKIEIGKSLPAIKSLETAMNHIGEGLSSALKNLTKSERMRTELITNVSHDLKTPLTSIISYIDLLKKENIENEVATEYVGVLVEKCERLKQLIEDLVEASKATTGNLKVELVSIELHQLAQQLMGEYSDRIQEKQLEIVFTNIEEVGIMADRRHMWRILENLLSNITKYAMPGTRVYIDITKDARYGILMIKNISKEQLPLVVEDLTERFVRGDQARTTEGSGLGLAIASSLASLQGGKLELVTDGDLFKVIVAIPLEK